jgi:hypothetical protein
VTFFCEIPTGFRNHLHILGGYWAVKMSRLHNAEGLEATKFFLKPESGFVSFQVSMSFVHLQCSFIAHAGKNKKPLLALNYLSFVLNSTLLFLDKLQ